MATLNASFVLDLDLFRHDGIVVERALIQNNGYGLAESQAGSFTISGTVKPARGQDLIQVGEGDYVRGDIVVITRSALQTGDANYAADRVWWKNAVYTVMSAKPYAFGDGYYRAICQLATINPSSLPRADDGGYLG